ncbi:hypothetical protein AC578_715 [Pseudocercospora eumusae]|uniref:Uncharacterized protein n=1 Tax=Pseudocercospora eumusae TaxID=321146 RepID=A0A139HN10_9PEZI|nr:hypothetical protein AC578_715 [Pseudocercospora eumusae]KXT03807.1 hypothetical protein AC578_715 [Pseudocercospora eumusae]
MHLHAFFLFSLLSLGVLAERATKRNAQPTPEPHPRALSTEELVDSPGFERRDVVYPTRCRAIHAIKTMFVLPTDAAMEDV